MRVDRTRPARPRRSNGIAGPAGLAAHAADLAATARRARHRSARSWSGTRWARSSSLVLRPPPPRAGVAARARRRRAAARRARRASIPTLVVQLILGPTAARLSHAVRRRGGVPATSGARTPRSGATGRPRSRQYLAYDLVGEEPEPASGDELRDARRRLDRHEHRHGAARRARRAAASDVLLTAERGLLDSVPALYATDPARPARGVPGLRHERFADVNHYTIVMSERGADAVAAVVRERVAAPRRLAQTGRHQCRRRSARSGWTRWPVSRRRARRAQRPAAAMRVVSWCACASSVRPRSGRRSGPNRNSTPVRLSAHCGWPARLKTAAPRP